MLFFHSNDLPGKSITSALEELMHISEAYPKGLPMMDMAVKDLIFHEQRVKRKKLETEVQRFRCVACSSFKDHVSKIILQELANLYI